MDGHPTIALYPDWESLSVKFCVVTYRKILLLMIKLGTYYCRLPYFKSDTIVKECTYIPDFGVMFIAETDSLIVSYSSYCDMCRFQSKDGFWDFDGTSIRDELYRLLKAEFPKDKYVRNITR